MTRLLPRSLFGQMLLILLAGLAVSHLVGTLIYASDRAQAVRAIGGYAATQRIANLTQLIDEAPAAWRGRIVRAANDPSLRVTLAPQPPAFADAANNAESQTIRSYLADQLPAGLGDSLQVAVVSTRNGFAGWPPRGPRQSMMVDMMARGHMAMASPSWMLAGSALRSLRAAVRLSDGEWLGFATALPNAAPPTPWPLAAATATMAVIVILASIWAVGRITAPLKLLADAAERLGRDVNAPAIAEAGSTEMRQAAQSFNQMQARIRRLLDNRTRMLAALSHDLRTPLTLLRLRTEALPDSDERERMLATIGEVDQMVGSTLRFARDQALTETRRRTDLAALLGSIVDDMADAGMPVTMTADEPVVVECQPAALRRALTNLIDNAVKYGGSAHIAVGATGSGVAIDVEDTGPGIPEAELQRVFEPFHRVEDSRSRETGGTGLGLSIAQSITQAHGGDIVLTNRAEGGLRARVSLPR